MTALEDHELAGALRNGGHTLGMIDGTGLSERTLKRRFLNATQLSPNVYLQKVRIDKAKKLLIATTLSVKEVAYEVGYENVSFFVRLFKSEVGHTPARWRTFEDERAD